MDSVRASLVFSFLAPLLMQGCASSTKTGYKEESVTVSSRAQVLRSLDSLRVAPELQSCTYDRSDYTYSQSLENGLILRYGGIYDPYELRWYDSKDSVDIEHIVATREAHVSGLCSDSTDGNIREQFANDTLNLVMANSSLNRSKGARDAAQWWPSHNQCWFARQIIVVRNAYQLSVDPEEKGFLADKINACDSFEMEITSTPYPNFLTDSAAGCGPFANCTELRRAYPNGVSYHHCAYEARLDTNLDGWICG
jgi:hypothetical protein